jgi:viologen exporter family transport system permease protein
MQTLRVALLHLRMGVMTDLQYRMNFALQVLQSLLQLFTGLVVFALVYSHTTELNGWSQNELLVVLGVQIVMGGVVRAVVQPNMMRFTEEVRDGKLDHALTKPVDAQMLVSVRQVEVWQAVDLLTGAGVIVVALTRLGGDLGALDVLAFAVALAVGAVLLYCFWMLLATLAFWIVNMWHLPELFEGVFQTGRWPIGIYPPWLRFSVTFLVPIAFAVTVPAEAVTSRLEWQTLALAAGFAVFLFGVTRWFWRFGLRSYSGASA